VEKTRDRSFGQKLTAIVSSPLHGFLNMYETILNSGGGFRGILSIMAGLALGWWLYVPVHELFHAAGCMIVGGEVTELRIQSLYGGDLLSRIFPFVLPGGEYAGRLSGFDTGGSDLVYANTVYFPYLLSLPGFLLLDSAVRKKAAFLFGFFIPVALAPLIGLTGDFFELGSLALFQLWPGIENANRTLISDDVFLLVSRLNETGESPSSPGSPFGGPMLFVIVSQILGLLFAWGTLVASDGIKNAARKSS
jgi:hypothetical protein